MQSPGQLRDADDNWDINSTTSEDIGYYGGKKPLDMKRVQIKGGRGGGVVKRNRASNIIPELAEDTMYGYVLSGRAALQVVVDEWIDEYKKDREKAVVDLIQFFVQCCGCRGKLSQIMFANQEKVKSIRKLTESFDEESGEYPLIQGGPLFKKFKSNLLEFIERLIRGCKHNIIYDEYMMDHVISWLLALSDSQVRAFRHTCTLIGMTLVTSLIDIAKMVQMDLENTERQLETELKKGQAKRAFAKVERLQSKQKELRSNLDGHLTDYMSKIFSGLFVHRYRDCRAEIRSICIQELGHWMKHLPSHFLKDQYLKYVGWTLHDRHAEVRLKSVLALQGLYMIEDFAQQLELFTARFKNRIVEMVHDKEENVAVQAVKLISFMLNSFDVLENSDCEVVYQLVFANNRNISHAAGEFLHKKLLSEDLEEVLKEHRAQRHTRKIREPHIILKELLRFFLENEVSEHGAYMVDSLWDTVEVLRDWKSMSELLLSDELGELALNDEEEGALIEIMTCAIKRAAGEDPPPGRGKPRQRELSTKERRQLEADRNSLTKHFIAELPELLSKFSTDEQKIVSLVEIPQYFHLEVYVEHRLNKFLELLLKYMHDIVMKHSDADVLRNCAFTFRYFINNELSIQTTAAVAFRQLIDELVSSFHSSVSDGLEGENEQGEFKLLVDMKRLYAFYQAHDITDLAEIEQDVSSIITKANQQPINDDITATGVMLMQVILSWALYRTNPSEPSKSELKKLRKAVVQLVQQCDELIQFGVANVQKEAFITVCDMLIIFAPQLKQNPNYSSLIVVPDKSVQIRLRDYVMTTVFAEEEPQQFQEDEDEEAKTEVLIEKRRVLASFGKLIAFNIIEMRLAAPIFAQYVKSYQEYGDIVKQMMSKARELNRTKCMRTQLLSLEQLFEELRDQNEGRIDRSSEEWTKIKDLAHRFALMAGVDNYKSRQAVVTFHREGIIYCLLRNGPPDGSPPSNIVFFDILAETTFKLMDIDKKGPKGLLAFLEEQLMKEGEIPEDEIEWGPLRTYRTALVGSMSDPYMYYSNTTATKRKIMESPMRVMEVKRPREDYAADNWQAGPSSSGNYVQ